MDKSAIISVLIRLLSEKREGLILLNGEWGVGKTFFLQHEFKKYYSHKNQFYISVLGLNSLQDFKDKMLSVTYLENPPDIEIITELASNVTTAITKEENTGRLAGKIISTFAGAMQHYVLKDLSGVFIIDDLERIPQTLRDEIATFCLQNYQNNKMLDYILVGNFSKQSNNALNHKEKVISDEIYFSINNLSEILDKKLEKTQGNYRDIIKQVIIGFEETNIRIINRVIVKLLPFFEQTTQDRDISDIDIKNLVSSLCAHTILKEKFNYKENEFHENIFSSSYRTISTTPESEQNKISEEENNLLSIIAYRNYNNKMAPYCFNEISHKDILPYVFTYNTPPKKDDYAGLARPELYSISEDDYQEEITKTILKSNSPNLSTWLTATNNYIRLSESEYIPRVDALDENTIKQNMFGFSDHEIKSYFHETVPNINSIPLHILKHDGDDLYNFFVEKYIEITKKEKIQELRNKMVNDGWTAIDMDIYHSDFKYKALETLDVDLIINAIQNSWSIYDIQIFSNHLLSVYNFSNLCDFLSNELPYLKKLDEFLNSYLDEIKISFRRGAIIELKNSVKKVKESLEKSISLINKT
ncbi:TPA: P-loop NTPase fold protein [Escherichia coli]